MGHFQIVGLWWGHRLWHITPHFKLSHACFISAATLRCSACMVFILIQLKNDKTTCQMNKEAHASVEIGQSIYHLHSLSESWSVLFSLYPLFCWSQIVCHLHSLSCQNIAVYCFSCIHDLSSFGEHVFLVLYQMRAATLYNNIVCLVLSTCFSLTACLPVAGMVSCLPSLVCQ